MRFITEYEIHPVRGAGFPLAPLGADARLHSCPDPAYLDSALSRVVLHAVGGSFALGEVQADLLFEDCKGIALELQGVIQKIIDWTVELNFGEAEKPPLFQFDIERKASFEQIMQAVDRKIPVSRSELYSSYGLPEPKDNSDAFVMENPQMLLSDGARSSGLKKLFIRLSDSGALEKEKGNAKELDSLCGAAKKGILPFVEKVVNAYLNAVKTPDDLKFDALPSLPPDRVLLRVSKRSSQAHFCSGFSTQSRSRAEAATQSTPLTRRTFRRFCSLRRSVF